MPVPEARIVEITARLSALGLRPERKDHVHHTTIQAALPASFPDAAWPDVLAVLESADFFGLADSTARGRFLWAAVRHSPRAAADATSADAAPGPPAQP